MMRRVVIDTNVIVSAALSPNGTPAAVISYIVRSGGSQVYYSSGILNEYREVLSRERFMLAPEIQAGIIDAISEAGILTEPASSDILLPDESDRIFYDTARAAGALLITGNTKHYPAAPFIMTPAQYLRKLTSEVSP